MARLSLVSLRLAFAVVAVVLISARESDSRLKTTGSFGIARAFAATAPTPDPKNDVAATPRLSSSYGKLPISFEANQGQTDARVRFLARGAGYNVFLTSSEVVLALHRSHGDDMQSHRLSSSMLHSTAAGINEATVETATVRMRLIGSDPSTRVEGIDALPGKANYLIGNDPRKWHVDVPTYAKVRFAQIYRGIDLVYYGNQEGRLEHDFVVAPGEDPNQIKFELRDEDQTPVLDDGELTLHTKAGDLRLRAPVAYQQVGNARTRVQVDYERGHSGAMHFRIATYDHRVPLIIDPVLVYNAVFGGNAHTGVESMAIDRATNVYVAGETSASDFPLVNPYQRTPGGSYGIGSVYICKLNPSGTALLYSTYLGPQGSNTASGVFKIAVDARERIHISGSTEVGFPVVNAYQPTYGGGQGDAYVAVLSPGGDSLDWSTYVGGTGDELMPAMTLDSSGNVFLGGYTYEGLKNYPPGTSGLAVVKFNSEGVLQYATVFPSGPTGVWDITADSHGSAYITGGGPITTTPGAFRTCPLYNSCPFVGKLTPAGDSFEYLTSLGDGVVAPLAIALDSDLNAYVGGRAGAGLTVWSKAFQRNYGGGFSDGFVVKLNANGSNLIWSTYLGGSGEDVIQGLVIDQYRQVYVSGFSCSPDFPLKSSLQPYAGTAANPCQYFATSLSGSLSSVQYYSTFLGGPDDLNCFIEVDPSLNVYLAGTARPNGMVPTPGAYSYGFSSTTGEKIFVSKLSIADDVAVTLTASPTPVPHGSNLTYTIGVTSKGPDFGVNVRLSDTLPPGTTFVSYDAGGGTCTAPSVGSGGTVNCGLAQLNKGTTWYVKLTAKVSANSGTTLSNMAATISNMQDFVTSNNSATITTHVN